MVSHSPLRPIFHLYSICVIAILCGGIYSNSLDNPFVFDDMDNIQDNQFIRLTELNLSGLHDAAFKSLHYFRPLSNITFAVNYYFGRYDVTGYHIFNILIHLANGILVYFLALLTFELFFKTQNIAKEQPSKFLVGLMALSAACIFVAHPIQVQSVTYIVQRMNSMAAMFYFLSLLLFILGRKSTLQHKRLTLWAGSICSWILALCCKQNAATLPIVILLYEFYFYQDLNKAWIRNNAKYLINALLLILLITFVYLGATPLEKILAGYNGRDFTMGERVLTEFRVVTHYISLLMFPFPSRLSLLPEFTLSRTLFNPITTLFSLIFLIGLLGYAFYFSRRHKLLSFCIFWFLINLSIESSIIGLEIIFEHRLYLPMFAFSIVSSYLMYTLFSNKLTLFISCNLIIIFILGIGSYSRNEDWSSVIALWNDVVSKNPRSHRGHYNLGIALANQSLVNKAMIHYRKAVSLKPSYAKAHNNLGNVLMHKNLTIEAIEHYNKALRINPFRAETHTNLGVALEKQNRIEQAISHYTKALHLDSENGKAHYLLGSVMQQQGELEQAKHHYLDAIALEPNLYMAHNNLGTILADQNKIPDAMNHFIKTIQINPEFAFAYFNLAYLQRINGNIDYACNNYRRGLKLKPDSFAIKEDIAKHCGSN